MEQKLARLRDTNLYMQQHKRELLREAALPEDYDEMHFLSLIHIWWAMWKRSWLPVRWCSPVPIIDWLLALV